MKVTKICAGSYEVTLSDTTFDYIVEVEKIENNFWTGTLVKYNKINDVYSNPESLFMSSTKKEMLEDIKNTLL